MSAYNDSRGFMYLPVELRLMIYELVLVAPEPLRPQEPGRAEDVSAPVHKLFDTSLLRVNHQIYEAKPTFYQKNLFNYTILPYGLRDLRLNASHPFRANFLTNMPHMTRICLNFTMPKKSYRKEWAIADYFQQVAQNCPLLRTLTLTIHGREETSRLTLHIIETLEPPGYSTTLIPDAASHYFDALIRSPKLERFTIIAQIMTEVFSGKNQGLAAARIQWLTEQEGRGDEFTDLAAQTRFAATAGLSPTRGDNKSMIVEELRSWTYRPREERALQIAAQKSQ